MEDVYQPEEDQSVDPNGSGGDLGTLTWGGDRIVVGGKVRSNAPVFSSGHRQRRLRAGQPRIAAVNTRREGVRRRLPGTGLSLAQVQLDG